MENISPALLEWFYKNRRSLPFREDPTPYHVWLSEVMLQQTRVSEVLPYYYRFLEALPDIPALAACEEEKLHKLWEGLGYYSRVRNLQKAAKLVCAQYGGQLPADYAALLALPGIGEYTAGAIASISFGLPVPAVDGNVLRVFSRLYNDPGVITEPAVKKAFTARVMEHQPPEKAGDYNQALMELGALVCVPNGAPLCGQCPLAESCLARAAGTTAQLPQKAKPKPRKIVPVTLALVESPAGFLVQQRPQKGLLAGLWQPVLWEDEHLLQAEGLARLMRLYGLSQEQAAQRVGKSQSAVANKLRLLRHSPQVLAMLRENQLSERHARALLRLPEEEDRLAVLQTVIRQQLNVAKTEAYIDAYLAKKNAQEPPKRGIRKLIVRDVRLFLNSVNHSLELVRSAGIQAETKQEETDREIVLTSRLPKRAG